MVRQPETNLPSQERIFTAEDAEKKKGRRKRRRVSSKDCFCLLYLDAFLCALCVLGG
jgi:hypothetical protein